MSNQENYEPSESFLGDDSLKKSKSYQVVPSRGRGGRSTIDINVSHNAAKSVLGGALSDDSELSPCQKIAKNILTIAFLIAVSPQCIGFAFFALRILVELALHDTEKEMVRTLSGDIMDQLTVDNYGQEAEWLGNLTNDQDDTVFAGFLLDTAEGADLYSLTANIAAKIPAGLDAEATADSIMQVVKSIGGINLNDYSAWAKAYNYVLQIIGSMGYNFPLSISTFLIMRWIDSKKQLPKDPGARALYLTILVVSAILCGGLFAPLANRAKDEEQMCLTPLRPSQIDAFEGWYRFTYIALHRLFTGTGQTALLAASYISSSAMMAVSATNSWFIQAYAVLYLMGCTKPKNKAAEDELTRWMLSHLAAAENSPLARLHHTFKAHAQYTLIPNGAKHRKATAEQKKQVQNNVIQALDNSPILNAILNMFALLVYAAITVIIMPSFIPVAELLQEIMKDYFKSSNEEVGAILSWFMNVVSLSAVLCFTFGLSESVVSGLYGLARLIFSCNLRRKERMQILKDAWPHLLGIFVFAFLSYVITTAASAANARLAALALGLSLAQTNLLILVTRLGTAGFNMVAFVRFLIGLFIKSPCATSLSSNINASGLASDTSYIGEARAKDKLKYNLHTAARMVGIPTAVFWLECLTSSLLSGFGITTTGTPHNKTAVEFNKTITCWTYPLDNVTEKYALHGVATDIMVQDKNVTVICPEEPDFICPNATALTDMDGVFYELHTPMIIAFTWLYAWSVVTDGFQKDIAWGALKALANSALPAGLVLAINFLTNIESGNTIGTRPLAGLDGGLLISFFSVIQLTIATSFTGWGPAAKAREKRKVKYTTTATTTGGPFSELRDGEGDLEAGTTRELGKNKPSVN